MIFGSTLSSVLPLYTGKDNGSTFDPRLRSVTMLGVVC